MASIQIPGIGSVEVPDFATDYTLQQVLNVLSSQEAERIDALNRIDQTLGTQTGIDRASLARDTTIVGNTGKMARMQQVQYKTTQQTLQHMKKQHKDMLMETKKQSGLWTTKMPQIMRAAGSMMTGKGIQDALSMMPGGLGQGIALATKVVGEFADSQRRLTDVGLGLGTSILNTGEAISSFRVPLSELERIAGTNAVTLDYLNDATGLTIDNMEEWSNRGVKQGVVAFGQLSKNVRDSMKQFGNMGFTVTEVNSFLAEYLETDRKRGVQADVSVSNLTDNFHKLALETAAYAADTGRNRKDLMKAQIENLNRTDASTYAMMLRMKGEDDAAKTFENNLALITNEMKSRYGDNADDMIDAWIQAQTQGRGLEATEAGAEMLAMLGPFGAMFDEMARSGKELKPEDFANLNDKLKESVTAYDTQNYALLATSHQSLQNAGNMLQHYRETTAEDRAATKARMKAEETSGATILKANEAVVDVTTKLQQGLLSVTNKLVGDQGTLTPALKAAIESVGHFSAALGSAASGKPGEALGHLGTMMADNKWLLAVLAGGVGKDMLTGRGGVLPMGLPGARGNRLASNLAMQQVAGASVGTNSVNIGGQNIATKGGKFNYQGMEYEVGKDGKISPTKDTIKSITGGRANQAIKGLKGGTLSGLFSIGMALVEGYDELAIADKEFNTAVTGMDKGSAEYKKAEAKLSERKKEIAMRTLGKGGGGIGGSMLMGAGVGMLGGGPLLSMLGMAVGGYYGYQYGGEGADALSGANGYDPERLKSLTASMADQKGDMSNQDLKTLSQLQANQELAKTDPSYLKLEEIRTLLTDHGAKLDVIKNASATTAIETKKTKSSHPALGD